MAILVSRSFISYRKVINDTNFWKPKATRASFINTDKLIQRRVEGIHKQLCPHKNVEFNYSSIP